MEKKFQEPSVKGNTKDVLCTLDFMKTRLFNGLNYITKGSYSDDFLLYINK